MTTSGDGCGVIVTSEDMRHGHSGNYLQEIIKIEVKNIT